MKIAKEKSIAEKKGRRKMKVRTVSEKEYTWEEIKGILAAGKAKETFGIEGQLTVKIDGEKEAVLNILDYDKDRVTEKGMNTMTVQFRDLILPEQKFDKNGSNRWEISSLREYLNGEEFKGMLEEGFRDMVIPAIKECDFGAETVDDFFLLSREEMQDKEKKYARFRTEKDKAKVNESGSTDWHWTRSTYRANSCGAWCVHSNGNVYYINATDAIRFAPACVIGAKAIH